jgi:pimeloyl-ACP methyl ester carboxylesterase
MYYLWSLFPPLFSFLFYILSYILKTAKSLKDFNMKKTIALLCMLTKLYSPELSAQQSGINLMEKTVSIQSKNCLIEGSLLYSPSNPTKQRLLIIIAGSGPTDRNGNNPGGVSADSYKMLSGALAKEGIASYRYDKRGIGKSQYKDFSESALVFDDYVADLVNLIDFLRDSMGFRDIYLAGHSEGSLTGMLAARLRPVKGFVSLSGAGRPVDIIIDEQIEKQPEFVKKSIDSILSVLKTNQRVDSVPSYLTSLFRPSVQPYMISWLKYDPAREIKKLTIPILIIQGSCDVQVKTKDAEILHDASPGSLLDIIPGMTHTLKNAGENCTDENHKTYTDPTLPLNTKLVTDLVSFIKEKK